MAKGRRKAKEKEEVRVSVSGGLRKGSISVEAEGIALRATGKRWKGKKDIELEPPCITASTTAKGGRLASYDFAVAINGVTKHIKGKVRDDITCDGANWSFAEFNLKEK